MDKNNISKELFENWLSEYKYLYIHLLPKKTSGLPQHLITNKIVVLQIGMNMAINILDLKVSDNNWVGTLSFNKRPHFIQCPFDAIAAITGTGNSVLFERKITKEILDAIEPEKTESSGNLIAVDFRNRKRK